MSITYHVCNDYSLESMTTQETEDFPKVADHLRTHPGKINGCAATCYRNFHGELVYITVESWDNLDGYML